MTLSAPSYIGRFAPSPTGPLHFGSLLSAVVSYLEARKQNGRWLVRIEDLDPPREQPGASDAILRCLEAHHLLWDDTVTYQSQRLGAYSDITDELVKRNLAYPCICSRKAIRSAGGIYPGTCRTRRLSPATIPAAIRLRVDPSVSGCQSMVHFEDLIQGLQSQEVAKEVGDFIIQRKDSLYAYQLAVVVDDIMQEITHVIRGSDLLCSTARQIYLFHVLGVTPPEYGHIPIAVNNTGQKLSKQNNSRAIEEASASHNLFTVLQVLNHKPPNDLRKAPPKEIIQWAVTHWKRDQLPTGLTLPYSPLILD